MTRHVHHVPGRLRIRIPELKRNAGQARTFAAKVRSLAGVRSVEANLLTGSLLVHYDTARTTADAVLCLLDLPGVNDVPVARGGSAGPGRKFADAMLWYVLEKAVERSVPLVVAALL